MKTKRGVLVGWVAVLTLGWGVAVRAQDAGTEMGAEDDLTVRGVQGTKSDPDFEARGYSAFGTNFTAATVATSGVGNVYIQNRLEIGAGVYVRGGGVIYPDNTTQTTAIAMFSLASGECDTNRLDILFGTNYLVSGVSVWQSPAIGQTMNIYSNGVVVDSFALTGSSATRSLSINMVPLDRLGIAGTNINGTVLFCFQGSRR